MVNCFILHVATGKETYFIQHANRFSQIHDLPCKLILPRREMTLRRRGKSFKETKPVFPGYVFWETDSPEPAVRLMLKKAPGYIRLITDDAGKPVPLTDDDRMIISSITSDGEVARRSLVYFDKKNRVRVLKGPLKGCEGSITKVDRRKKRVTVEINLHDKRFKISFEYEEVEKTDKEKSGKSGQKAGTKAPG